MDFLKHLKNEVDCIEAELLALNSKRKLMKARIKALRLFMNDYGKVEVPEIVEREFEQEDSENGKV